MSASIACTIYIGGTTSQEKADELDELLGSYSESDRSPGKAAFAQGEALDGEPEDLIGFCTENGLMYWRHHDGNYDLDPRIYIYNPETGEEESCPATGDYVPLISAQELKKYASVPDALVYLDRFNERVPPLVVT